MDGLFESVLMGSAGQRGEAVFADVAVSVVSSWATKGLIEIEQVREINSEPDDGWSIIETVTAAKMWEERLANIAPARCERLASNVGAALLERTKNARRAVEAYLSHLPPAAPRQEAVKVLRSYCSEDQRTAVDRLRNWPGVLQVEGEEPSYEIAALLIVFFADAVEGGVPGGLADPLQNVELMWRLQLLRDRLAWLPA
jgi:hypothetical protein